MEQEGTPVLPVYRLEIGHKERQKLEQDVWSNKFVDARLHTPEGQFDVLARYRGHHTRKLPKRSYNLRFLPEGPDGVHELHLNADYVDPGLMRSKLSFDLFAEIGVVSPSCEPVWLEVDGRPPGLWLAMESIDEVSLKRRGLAQGSIYYAVDGDANFSLIGRYTKRLKQRLSQGYEKKYPKDGSWRDLERFIFTINSMENFAEQVGTVLDVERYLDWLLGAVFVSNTDGFGHNYALYGNGATGRFSIIPWDYEGSWGRDPFGRALDPRHVPIGGRNCLSARLMRTARWRTHYARRVLELLDGALSLPALTRRMSALHDLLRPYAHRDTQKGASNADFDAEPAFMLRYTERRVRYLGARARTLLRSSEAPAGRAE